MTDVMQQLNESLFSAFQKQTLVLLGTVDHESGSPSVSAISWVTAPDHSRMRFALAANSRLVDNIRGNQQISLTVFANQTVYSIYGAATVIANPLDEVPMKLACVEMNVSSVREAMYYGSRIAVEPECEKTYDIRAAEKLDGQVFAAMKKA